VGASVILVNGALACYVSRGEKQLHVFLPEDEPERTHVAREVARTVADRVRLGARKAMLVTEISGKPTSEHPLAPFLIDEGFIATAMGFQLRRRFGAAAVVAEPADADLDGDED